MRPRLEIYWKIKKFLLFSFCFLFRQILQHRRIAGNGFHATKSHKNVPFLLIYLVGFHHYSTPTVHVFHLVSGLKCLCELDSFHSFPAQKLIEFFASTSACFLSSRKFSTFILFRILVATERFWWLLFHIKINELSTRVLGGRGDQQRVRALP